MAHSCLILPNPMGFSIPGFPVLHYVLVCSNSCLLSLSCHPTISSSVILFSCLQSFPASESFPSSHLFASGGQNIGASASVLLMDVQGLFPLGLTGLISPRDSQESSPAPQFESISSLALSFLYGPTLTS